MSAASAAVEEAGAVLAPADFRSRWAPWLEGLLLATVVLMVVTLGGQAVRTSYHGYLHTSIGESVLRQGLLPENPYHAGAPLRYYTLYPTLGVLLGRLGGGALWGFALLNILAALLLGPSLDALGRRLGLRFWARRGAFLAMILAFNGLGYWLATGAGPVPPDGAQPLLILRDFTSFRGHSWDARLQAFLPKLFNVSSFALALPLALAALAQLLGALRFPALRRIRWQAGILLGLATAINPLVGVHAALLFCLFVVFAGRSQAPGLGGLLRHWWSTATLALLCALPFLLPLLQAAPVGAPQQAPEFPLAGDGSLWNLLGPLLPLAFLGLPAWWRMRKDTRLVLLAALAAAVLMSFLKLPWDNQYKFPRVAGLFLALPAGMALAPGPLWRSRKSTAEALPAWRRLWSLAGILLLLAMVPTSWRTAQVYAAWSDGDLLPLNQVADGRLALSKEAALRAFPPAVAAAERQLPANAVLLMHPRHPIATGRSMGASGNRLAPILHHSLFVDEPQIHNQDQPDLRRRLDLEAAVWSGKDWSRNGPGTRDMDRVASLLEIRRMFAGRGLAILSLDGDEESRELFAAQGGAQLASENGVSLWWFAPLPAAAESAVLGVDGAPR